MNQATIIQRQADMLRNLNNLAGDYSAFMASLICEETHPEHSRFTTEWKELTPEQQATCITKDGKPSFFIYVKKKCYASFMKAYGEAWSDQLLCHVSEQVVYAQSGKYNFEPQEGD